MAAPFVQVRAQNRTLGSAASKSAMGHVWTAPGWQEESSRRSIGRSSHVFGLLARFT
jgi:hypothetical protein